MRVKVGRIAAGAGVAGLVLSSLALAPPAASAAPAGVAFSSATFGGTSSGDELHLGSLSTIAGLGSTGLATVDEAVSGATTNSAGLASAVDDPEISGDVIQPAQSSSVKAYAEGDPLGATLADAAVVRSGFASQTAPPNRAAVSNTGISVPSQLSGLASAGVLDDEASAFYPADSCPLGQPLSYGSASAASSAVLPSLSGLSSPLATTPGGGTADSSSEEVLSPNGNGTFGLTSQVAESLVPVALNLLNLLQLQVTVQGADPGAPITWSATNTGSGSTSLALDNAGAVVVSAVFQGTSYQLADIPLTKSGTDQPVDEVVPLSLTDSQAMVTALTGAIDTLLSSNTGVLSGLTGPLGGLVGDLGTGLVGTSTSSLDSALQSVLGNATLSLGSIGVAQETTSATGGTVDLATVNLKPDLSIPTSGGTLSSIPGLSSAVGTLDSSLFGPLDDLDIAGIYVGHMTASATLASPISCPIPMTKTSDPTAVSAGNTFTSNIFVPDPADGLACNLTGLDVTDTITDYQGSPTFTVTSASNSGTIKTVSATEAVVTWTGLSWSTGNPPLDLKVGLSVPASSPSGIIEDTATSSATTSGCSGGSSGVTGIDDGIRLTGTATLAQPSVTARAASVGTPGGTAAPPSGTNPLSSGQLPFTGAMGGLWQPLAGVGLLAGGAGVLTLVRRARRLSRG